MNIFRTIFYDVTRKLVGAFGRFFYWRIRIRGFSRKKFKKRSIMFVSNHQNALMDPLHLPCYTPLRPSFLTRSDVFVPPIMDKILYALKLLPIFRQRDGSDPRRKNKVIFNKCVQHLKNKESILIFPEGSHDIKRRLRTLKKGFTDILFQAEAKHDWTLDSWVVPVMVNYEAHRFFGKDVVVLFGEPLEVGAYRELYETDIVKARTKLARDVHAHMLKGMIHLDPAEHYPELSNLYESSQELVHGKIARPYNRFLADKSFFDKLGKFLKAGGVSALQMIGEVKDYFVLKEELGLTGLDLSANSGIGMMLLRVLALIVAFPLYVFGLLTNYFPYLGGKIAADRAADPCFKSTTWFIAWMVGVLIYHPILILVFMNSVSSKPIYVMAFWLTILFCGRMAMWWWKQFEKLRDSIIVFSKRRNTSFQILEEMQNRLKRRFAENELI